MSRIDSLQTTLAAEHAAVWVFGTLGGQTSRSAQPELHDLVQAGYLRHRSRRDQLMRWLLDASETPVGSEAGYALPNTLRNAKDIRITALRTERRCTATYADMVGRTTGKDRAWATNALIDAALRELEFGGTPQDLPGVGA